MSSKSLQIPEKIQENINERWFYLYEWIKPLDVKNSIKKSFLKILKKFWNKIIIVFLIIWILFLPTLSTLLIVKVFFWFTFFIAILILIFLFFVWIKKSYFMLKNSYIVITNSFILVNWKALEIDNFILIQNELKSVENIFERKLFANNNEINLLKELKKEFLSWYSYIYNKKIWSIVIILFLFYTIHILLMSVIYSLWIFLVWLLSLFIGIINRFILIKVWHKVTNINSLFLNIDKSSNSLENSKLEVKNYLEEAKSNSWEDWLLLKINNSISKINDLAKNTINLSLKLKEEMIKSKYKDIYDFKIYDNWIKKQIYKPLFDIKELLEVNLKILSETIGNLERQIKSTDEICSKPLKLQKIRIDLQIKEVSDNINIIQSYLLKLI